MKKMLLFSLFLLLPPNAFGAAFLIYNQDAKANGMGMAVVSSIDNPSAVFYNPAMLIHQKGTGFSVGNTMIIPGLRFEDPATGKRTYAKTTTHHLPNMYAKYTKDDVAFGIGIFSPFGLSTEWPKDWPGRYTTFFAEMKTTYINPVFAYRVNDRLSFGVGMAFIKSSVSMKSATNLSAYGLPDGVSRLTGDGDGVGYNAAVTLKLPKEYTVSLTYRSHSAIKYIGKAYFYNVTTSSSTAASATFVLPFVAVGGISKQTGPLTLEGDILYTGWSSMSNYRIASENGSANSFYYKNWCNTPSIAFGANYRLNKFFEIRCGYMYDKSPVPRKTLNPDLPDSTRHIYTGGATFQKGSFKAGIGYQATFFKDVTSYLPAIHGTYKNFAHLGFLSLEYNH